MLFIFFFLIRLSGILKLYIFINMLKYYYKFDLNKYLFNVDRFLME